MHPGASGNLTAKPDCQADDPASLSTSTTALGTGVQSTARWLGWGGLLPFLGLPTLLALVPFRRTLWESALATYSLGILCFLLGTWWGLALVRRYSSALLLSNALFLMAFFSFLLLPLRPYLVIAATLFITLILVERKHPLFQLQPDYYSQLRLMLSVTASIALLIGAALATQTTLQ